MSHRFYKELSDEIRHSRQAELKGILHPKRQIQYNSRVHKIRENQDIIIFFIAIIISYSLLVWFAIIAILNGFII